MFDDLSAWLNSGEPTVDRESGRLVDPTAVSYRIGLARREAGFTQEEAAAKLGVSPEEIQAWETAGESYLPPSDPLEARFDRIEQLLGRLGEYVEAMIFEKEYRAAKS